MRIERPAITDPKQIEKSSMAIIEPYLSDLNLNHGEKTVYQRIIHTAGDPGLASAIKLSPDFVFRAVSALKDSATIITDVQMVKAGVNQKHLEVFGNEIICEIQNPVVAALATQLQTTRSAAAVNFVAPTIENSIFVVGNAPTALYELLRLCLEEGAKPAAIVGVPVGFVGAAESKTLLMSLAAELQTRGIGWLSLAGTRGGSAIAAAVINALLILGIKGA